jgi:pimeloyl-ACP methyl ester carboxylesterase
LLPILTGLAPALTGTCVASAARAEPARPLNRTEAVKILADLRRIVTPDGVERLEKVRIGGIDQWVSIRGVDRRNPVLLMLHGGPGYVSMPTSWYFQRGWEEYFTVVQWDQRGAGKTYLANDPKAIAPTMTFERMLADTEEMIEWLRKEFGKQKIFVLGHSWGSFLGLKTAERHPQWLHAYIGMGQGANMPESERRGWKFAMERARAAKNETAIRELQSIAPYATGDKVIPLEHLYLQRKWLTLYGGVMSGRQSNAVESAAVLLSPEYSDAEIRRVWDGNEFSENLLLAKVVALDLSTVTELKCPVILLAGRDDYNASSSVAAEWFERLRAPSKKFVWFEHTAHEVMNEAPGKTLVSLVKYALPLAEHAGDVAPQGLQ